jgi:hypothetical protein
MKDLSKRRRIADARAVQKNNGVKEAVGAFAVSSQAAGRVGPIGRFTSDAQVARHSGVAPLEASSGRMQRHRQDRDGDASSAPPSTGLRSPGRASTRRHARTERKRSEGKSRREAIRCLNRRLVRVETLGAEIRSGVQHCNGPPFV